MKRRLFLFLLLMPILTMAQVNFDGSITQIDTCDTYILYDSGGPSGNYGNNENFTMTLCPSVPNSQLKIDFLLQDMNDQYDLLLFYDGTSINAPYMGYLGHNTQHYNGIQASASNTSGCVTLEWSTNGQGTGQGFELEVSCQLPCQSFYSELVSSFPATDSLGYIDICPYETVTFSGQGNYFENDTLYTQADSTSTFKWLIEGVQYTGQTATHTFQNPGGHKVQLEITDAQGCKNTNLLNQKVRVAPSPTFNNTQVNINTICLGDTVTLQGYTQQQTADFATGGFSGDTVIIPTPAINSTLTVSSDIIIDGFAPGQIVDDTTDIIQVCANLNSYHAWDLEIKLICPSGQSMILHDDYLFTNPTWSAGFFGPSYLSTVSLDYCWTPTTNHPTIKNFMQINSPTYIHPNAYDTDEPFTNLLGCPLNGVWTLEILKVANTIPGHLYNWSIDFADSLYLNNETFTPQTISSQWLADSTIISSVGDSVITVVPTQVGTAAYTFATANDYGCLYDTTVTILVGDCLNLSCDSAYDIPHLQDTTICQGESFDIDATVQSNHNIRTFTYAATGQTIPSGDTVRAMVNVSNIFPNPLNTNALQSVCLDIDHNNPEDLDIYLITPSGFRIELSTDNGAGTPNAYDNTCFVVAAPTTLATATPPFTGNYRPEQSFMIINTLNNIDPNGTWTLEIIDDDNLLSNGTLNNWSITFTNQQTFTYFWTPNTTGLSCTNCPNPTITPTNTADYIVAIQGSLTGCIKRDTMTVTVLQPLAAPTIICDSATQNSINFTWSAIPNAISYEVNINNNGWQPSSDSLGHWVLGLLPNQVVNIEMRGVQNECTLPSGIGTASCTTLPCDVVGNISTIQHVTCPSGNDGNMTISATSTNNITQYIYHTTTISDSNNTGIFNNLIADNYQIIIQDVIGCSDTITITLTEPNPITPNEIIINNICFGENNGSITLNPTGGTSPFSYLWSDNTTDSLLTNLSSGSYSVTITDSENCMMTQTFDILPLQPLTINLTTTTQTDCGASDATITTTVTGGVQPYAFLWNDGNTSQNRMGLDTGMYVVTITDTLGCTVVDTAVLHPIHTPITFVDASYAIVNCTDIDSQKIVICAYGDAPLEYSINGGTTWHSSNIFSGLPIGTYQVALRYMDGTCVISGGDYTIGDSLNDFTMPTQGFGLSYVVPVSCNGGSDGEIHLDIPTCSAFFDNGYNISDYQVYWSDNGSSDSVRTGLTAGTYHLTFTQPYTLVTTSCSFTVPEPDSITTTLTTTLVTDCNGNDGTATVTAIGGTPNYNYIWNNNDNTATANNLTSGTAIVTVTDANNCIKIDSVTILEPEPITFNVSHTNLNCHSSSIINGGNVTDWGTITINVLSGTTYPSYEYSIDCGVNWQASNIFIGLAAGTYGVTVRYINGTCQTFPCQSITITEPNEIITSTTGIAMIDCNSNYGSATVNAISNNQLSYLWSNGDTTATISNLTSGMYYVTVTELPNNCQKVDSFLIEEPQPITFTLSQIDVACNSVNANNTPLGTITINVTSGDGAVFGGYQYTLDCHVNDFSNNTFINLAPGTYSAGVSYNQNSFCETPCQPITIIAPDSIVTNLQSTMTTDCNGNNGTATVAAIGGTPNYNYIWNNNDNTQTANNLTSGTAIVTVTDANNCIKIDSVTILEPEPITFSTNQTNLICHTNNLNGTPLGTITINVLSGTTYPNYEYSIDCGATWQTSNTFTNLPVGNYDATVRYSNATCQTPCQSVTITQPDSLDLSFTTSQVTCYGLSDETATVSAVGGDGNYSYLWNNNNQNTATATNLSGGFFEVTVTDGNTCQTSDTVYVYAPVLVNIDAISSTPTLCFGSNEGTISATASGGTGAKILTWADSLNQNFTGQNVTSLYAGMYHLTASDQQGCIAQDSVRVLQPDSLVATFIVDSLDCFNDNSGSATVNISGGTLPYSFIWNNNSNINQANNLPSAFAIVTITDANNCVLIDSVFVPQPLPLSLNMSATQVSCFGQNDGTATVLPSGGTGTYNYLWSNNSQNNFINNLSGGMVYVTVSDANNCTTNDSIFILENNILSVLEDKNDVLCFGENNGNIQLSPNGGTGIYTFQWQNSTVTDSILNNLSVGIYTYTVTDSDGCNYSDTVEITEPQPLNLSLISTNPTCLGGANGTATATVFGGTLPYNYTWSRQSQNAATVQNLTGGWISVTITDANNCTITDSIFVHQPDPISITTTSTPTTCIGGNDGTATATVSGGLGNYTYVWTNATGQNLNQNLATAINLQSGQYFVAATDTNNCTVIDSVIVNEPEPLEITPIFTSISCFGGNDGSITLNISNIENYTFLWENGETSATIQNLESGNYSVTITDSLNCIFRDTIFINQPTEITPNFQVKHISCYGENDGEIKINPTGGTPNYRYDFNKNGFTNSNRFIGLTTGNYEIITQDANGCKVIDSIEITEPQPITVDLGDDILTEVNTQITVNATVTNGTAPFTYIWNPADSSLSCTDCLDVVITATEAIKRYDFIVTDANGCLGEDFIMIRTNKERTVFVATAFTPNNDGNNDVLFVQSSEATAQVDFQVFDRWGELVFETKDAPINDENYGWNGTYKGQKIRGTFVWMATVKFEDGTEEILRGSVLLIR